MPLEQSSLDQLHRQLNAKMVSFGGWEMPLSYPSGTIKEHLACRQSAAVFDVSHLGHLHIEGEGSFELLQEQFSNDLSKISVGKAQYTHLLDPQDASVLDDIIIWWSGPNSFEVMPNASNVERVQQALPQAEDVRPNRALIAIQGPLARQVMQKVSPQAAEVPYFGVINFVWNNVECMAAGTGYTGEDGLECSIPSSVAQEFFNKVIEAGAIPAGLGARDTLRLEAGLPLHGHELGAGITPLQAGLGWTVGWSKASFRGKEPLEKEKSQGIKRKLVGLVSSTRRPPRQGYKVIDAKGENVGFVTSGNFSPILGKGIALAFLDVDHINETQFEIDMKTEKQTVTAIKLPFVAKKSSQKS